MQRYYSDTISKSQRQHHRERQKRLRITLISAFRLLHLPNGVESILKLGIPQMLQREDDNADHRGDGPPVGLLAFSIAVWMTSAPSLPTNLICPTISPLASSQIPTRDRNYNNNQQRRQRTLCNTPMLPPTSTPYLYSILQMSLSRSKIVYIHIAVSLVQDASILLLIDTKRSCAPTRLGGNYSLRLPTCYDFSN